MKSGDLVLVALPLTGEDIVGTVTSIIPTHKYPISDVGGGNKRRNYRDENGTLCTITAEEEGCKGDEMIMCTDIWLEVGSLHVKEIDDIESFNIRKISEDHPKYDKKAAKGGKMMGDFFGAMMKAEENGEEDLGASMMKALGSMFGQMGKADEE